jgi:hypothetical protein
MTNCYNNLGEQKETQLKRLADIAVLSAEKREFFFRHVLLASSGMLGILVSLHSMPSPNLYIRLVFVIAAILLTLGILTCTIVLYDLLKHPARLRQAYQMQLQSALKESQADHLAEIMTERPRTKILEISSYILLSLSLLFLLLYVILSNILIPL